MIEHLTGDLIRRDDEAVVVRVAGIGFRVEVPDGSFMSTEVGEVVTVLTSLSFRQDGFALYGFQSATDRQFFTMLTSISGIGPKSALNILSHAAPAKLADAIVNEDLSSLTKVKGIGKKTALRIILELKEKIRALKPDAGGRDGDTTPESAALIEARDVLLSLGCTEEEADKALEQAKVGVDLESEEAADRLVMEALQALSGR